VLTGQVIEYRHALCTVSTWPTENQKNLCNILKRTLITYLTEIKRERKKEEKKEEKTEESVVHNNFEDNTFIFF